MLEQHIKNLDNLDNFILRDVILKNSKIFYLMVKIMK